jgi:hypothetical protein
MLQAPPCTPPDHNAAPSASRRCHVCRRSFTADEQRRDPAWEPTHSGWRCGDCSRARRRRVRERALELIARTEPRWTLILSSPEHGRLDECLECDVLEAASAVLLAPGGLSGAEAASLREAVLSAS